MKKNSYKLFLPFLVQLFFWTSVWADCTVSGYLSAHPHLEIRLKGYDGFSEQVFSKDTIEADGHFSLHYPKQYSGMGVLEVRQAGSLLLILDSEEIQLKGINIQDYASLQISNSPENEYFGTYVQQQAIISKKIEGWKWLKPLYAAENTTSAVYRDIVQALSQLEGDEAALLGSLPEDKYAAYFIPLRKLVENRPISVQRYKERIPQHIEDFKAYDLRSKDLWQSGLLGTFYDGHFILLETAYGTSQSAQTHIEESIDHIIDQLTGYDDQLLQVSEHLFKLFEKRSLFSAAEYLSLKMLAQNSCTVTGELARRFEQYRSMKQGNITPNIIFERNEQYETNGFKNKEENLLDIDSKYKLVAFWSSECSHCMEELPKLQNAYTKLQDKGIEVIAISLDTDRQAYLSASKEHPWYSYCDFKSWESPLVQDYYVFATPSFYLLDKENRIIKKIISVAQLETIADNHL